MRLVHAVGRADEDQVAERHGRGVRHVVRKRADFLHHVELPDDVRVGVGGELLARERSVVLLVTEALQVGRHHLAAVVREVDDLVLDEGRRADPLERPVVHASRRQLFERGLPHELAVGLAEGHEHAAITGLLRIPHEFVVGPDEHQAPRHRGVAVGLRSQLGHPLHVPLRFHVPRRRQVRLRRDHVARRMASPHRPVTGRGRDVDERGADRGGGGRGQPPARETRRGAAVSRSHENLERTTDACGRH